MDAATQSTPIVAIGSSAGGLEALIAMFSKADVGQPFAYVVAQHLDPKHSSMLTELISRATKIPVLTIQSGMYCEPGRIYVTPPGSNVSLDGGLFLLTPADQKGPKPSVDVLFKSIAAECKSQGIAVILSGTGSDGSKGVREIKNAGGLVLAQDRSAKYSGMPEAAIETGLVDLVLPAVNMIDFILKNYDGVSPSSSYMEIKGPKKAIERVFSLLLERTGQDFSGYKLKTVSRRLERRMKENGIDNVLDYIPILERSAEEVDYLLKEMLISVTSFFREPEAFKTLKNELKELILRKGLNSTVRVWVPGCATGEEAFSIAILLEECAEELNWSSNYQVFATDLDDDALRVGRRGAFQAKGLEDVDSALLDRFFFYKEGYYQIHSKIREKVIFARQNVVSDPPFSRLDLISCRNLLIYFGPRFQRRVAAIFHYSLVPEGLLLLGKSESFTNFESTFKPVNKRYQIYKRLEGDAKEPGYHRSFIANVLGKAKPSKTQLDGQSPSRNINNRIEKSIHDFASPPCVVVNLHGDVVHFRGDVSPFMRFPQGKVDFDVLNLVHDNLRLDLRYNLSIAQSQGSCCSEATSYNALHKDRVVEIKSQKLVENSNVEGLIAIFFNVIQLQNTDSVNLDDSGTSDLVKSLQRELKAVRNHLDVSINELEVTNEELQSSNEELQSANEELQSSNEELQTSNEELQSANEELSTLNEELEIKSSELFSVNHDLELILQNVGSPVVLIDTRLRVIRFTHQAGILLGLTYKERGETLTTLGLPVMIKGLRDKLQSVIETGLEGRYSVDINSVRYTLQLLPHMAENGAPLGAMMVFDKTSDLIGQSALSQGISDLFELEAEMEDSPFLLLDAAGSVVYASATAQGRIHISPSTYLKKPIYTLFPTLEVHLDDCANHESERQSYIAACPLSGGEQQNFLVEFYNIEIASYRYIFLKLLS
jgi:two-component system CheB/CheR fusion protein